MNGPQSKKGDKTNNYKVTPFVALPMKAEIRERENGLNGVSHYCTCVLMLIRLDL